MSLAYPLADRADTRLSYRLNMFGFASSRGLQERDTLNVGLLDQRLGLEWIQKHVRQFGGDPDNITLFGQSTGAISIGHQINAFGASRPVPFRRAIMQSGMSTSVAATTSKVTSKYTADVTRLLGCSSRMPDPAAELSCLQSLPFRKILSVVEEYAHSVNPRSLLVWRPVAEGSFMPAAPSELVATGRFASNISVLSGWNEDDGTRFVTPNITTVAEVLHAVVYPATLDDCTVRKLLTLYPTSRFASRVGDTAATVEFFQASQMFRDTQFVCPALLLSQAMLEYSSEPTPTYLYDMNTTIAASQQQADHSTYLGVSHGSEIPFVFNDLDDAQERGTDGQRTLADHIAGSWTAFATTGNVSSGLHPVPGWRSGHENETDGFKIRILGGPSDGMAESFGETLDKQEIATRCHFWNQVAVQKQLQK